MLARTSALSLRHATVDSVSHCGGCGGYSFTKAGRLSEPGAGWPRKLVAPTGIEPPYLHFIANFITTRPPRLPVDPGELLAFKVSSLRRVSITHKHTHTHAHIYCMHCTFGVHSRSAARNASARPAAWDYWKFSTFRTLQFANRRTAKLGTGSDSSAPSRTVSGARQGVEEYFIPEGIVQVDSFAHHEHQSDALSAGSSAPSKAAVHTSRSNASPFTKSASSQPELRRAQSITLSTEIRGAHSMTLFSSIDALKSHSKNPLRTALTVCAIRRAQSIS